MAERLENVRAGEPQAAAKLCGKRSIVAISALEMYNQVHISHRAGVSGGGDDGAARDAQMEEPGGGGTF